MRSSPLKLDAKRQKQKSRELSRPKNRNAPARQLPSARSRKLRSSPRPLKVESKEIRIKLERGRNNEFDIKSSETTFISAKARSKSKPKTLKQRTTSGAEARGVPKLPRVALLASQNAKPKQPKAAKATKPKKKKQ